MALTFIFIVMLAVLISFGLFFVLFFSYFNRDPERNIPHGNCIVSPADGKIVRIMKSDCAEIDKGLFGKFKVLSEGVNEPVIVCIMMNVHNVHVQRSPISGKVVKVEYTKGSFRNAVHDSHLLKWVDNERNKIVIKNNEVTINVIQVAGVLARRIRCYVKTGRLVDKGERIGRILLGSMVVVVFPLEFELRVREDQAVLAGETILGDCE